MKRPELLALLAFLFPLATPAHAQSSGTRFVNPSGLTKASGYTHVVVSSDGRTAYIAGQVAFDSAGNVVGEGDFKAQAEQVFKNLRVALGSVGATFKDVMKTTTFITDLKNSAALRETRGRYFDSAHPPANSLIPVSGLARPGLMLEIEAVVDLSARRGQ